MILIYYIFNRKSVEVLSDVIWFRFHGIFCIWPNSLIFSLLVFCSASIQQTDILIFNFIIKFWLPQDKKRKREREKENCIQDTKHIRHVWVSRNQAVNLLLTIESLIVKRHLTHRLMTIFLLFKFLVIPTYMIKLRKLLWSQALSSEYFEARLVIISFLWLQLITKGENITRSYNSQAGNTNQGLMSKLLCKCPSPL